MSHVVMIKTMVRDYAAVEAACRRLRWPTPRRGEASLFSQTISGLVVAVPDWVYPIAADLTSGQLQYDNHGGVWGDPKQHGRFLQAYAIEKTGIEARESGRALVQRRLANGSFRLTIRVEGGS